jgi:hypothetical protein
MSGFEERSPASVTTPLRTSRPASSASRVLGVIPTPTMTASAGTAVGQPHAVRPVARCADLGDLDAAAQVHSPAAVQIGEHLGRLPAEHP